MGHVLAYAAFGPLAVWAAIPLLVGAGGLVVDSASPDALCPPLEPTRELVAARLGNVELEGTWRATYVLVHRNDGDFVALTLSDPEGATRLERQFPVQGGSCATLSQVIALVLERYFSTPEGASAEEAAPVAPAETRPLPAEAGPEPSSASAPTLQPASRALPEPRDAPSSPEDAPHVFRADAGLWVTNGWLAPAVRLWRHFGRYGLGVGAAIDLSDHDVSDTGGSIETRRVPLSLSGSYWLTESAFLNTKLAFDVLAVVEHARSEGLAEDGTGTRVVPGLGARLGTEFLDSELAGPFVELTAAGFLTSAVPAFLVDEREVQAPNTFVVGAAFGIHTSF